MLKLEINSLIIPQDNIWLKKMHKGWKNKLMTIVEEENVAELLTSKEVIGTDNH